jgi:hypothetical protein
VLEHLAEITAIDPAIAGWTSDEVVRFVLCRIADRPAHVLASGHRCHGCDAAGKTVSWPVCKSLTVTLLLGFWLLMKVAAPIAVSIVSRQYWVLPSNRNLNLAPKQSASLIYSNPPRLRALRLVPPDS